MRKVLFVIALVLASVSAIPPSGTPAQTPLIEDTRAVDLGLSVFWADRNVGADGEVDCPGESGAIWSSDRDAERYYMENNYRIFLQMTKSTSEKYRHYIRSYHLYEKMSLRPVMAKSTSRTAEAPRP